MINYYLFQLIRYFKSERGEFGISAILGIAIALTVAAFVVLPGVKSFAGTVVSGLDSWWTGTVSGALFDNTLVN
jgi:hypothetical protein